MRIIFIGIEAEKTFTHLDPESGERFRFHKEWGAEYNVPCTVGNYLIALKPNLFGETKESIVSNRGLGGRKIPIAELEAASDKAAEEKEKELKEISDSPTLIKQRSDKRKAVVEKKKPAVRKKKVG